jgi:hypothetical protein
VDHRRYRSDRRIAFSQSSDRRRMKNETARSAIGQKMKNWKSIAHGNQLDLTPEELDRAATALDALESAFRPLVATIPHDVEPAINLLPAAVDPE